MVQKISWWVFPLLLLAACKSPSAMQNKTEKCLGTPDLGLLCPTVYDPVCGCNGRTYSNACSAEAAGILITKPGACPDTLEDGSK